MDRNQKHIFSGKDRAGRPAATASVVAALSLLLLSTGPVRADTRAGTVISNTAQLRYDVDGQTQAKTSNTVTITVAERLDIGLSHDGSMVMLDITPVAVPVTLTNAGSGDEAFTVTTGTSTPAATVTTVAIDTDGDGRFEPGRDPVVTGSTPVLAPGETLALIAVLAPVAGAGPADGSLTVSAQATTGHGAPERTLPGQGDGGGDAVVGQTGAIASTAIPFASTQSAAPTLVKTQTATAADGTPIAAGAAAGSGAVVTYTLVARFPAGAALSAAAIDDPVPADAVYLPGTLSLDGAVLSDAADGDPGGADGRTVAVRLPDAVAADAVTHTVQFKVRLQ